MAHSGECFDQEMKRSTRDLHERAEKPAQLVLHVSRLILHNSKESWHPMTRCMLQRCGRPFFSSLSFNPCAVTSGAEKKCCIGSFTVKSCSSALRGIDTGRTLISGVSLIRTGSDLIAYFFFSNFLGLFSLNFLPPILWKSNLRQFKGKFELAYL